MKDKSISASISQDVAELARPAGVSRALDEQRPASSDNTAGTAATEGSIQRGNHGRSGVGVIRAFRIENRIGYFRVGQRRDRLNPNVASCPSPLHPHGQTQTDAG